MTVSLRDALLLARVALRLDRNLVLRRSASVLAVIVASLVLLGLLQSSLTLTGEQIVARDLGRFSYRYEFTPASISSAPAEINAALELVRSTGIQDVGGELSSIDIRPVSPEPVFSIYVETDWASTPQPYPGRFELLSGRWPRRAGEAVVSAAAASGGSDQFAILSGLASVRPVGVVEDSFGRKSARILAAPGTIRSFDAPTIGRRFTALDLQVAISWNGQKRVSRLVVPRLDERFSGALFLREDLAMRSGATFADRYPLGYQVPAFALPVLASFSGIVLSWHALRRTTGSMRDAGLGRSFIVAAFFAAVLRRIVLASSLAVLAGVIAALGVRPLLAEWSSAPLGPMLGGMGSLAGVASAVVLGCAMGLGWLLASNRELRGFARKRPATGHRSGHLRIAAGVAAGVVALGSTAAPLSGVGAAMSVVAGLGGMLLLLTPEAVRGCLAVLPTRRPVTRLARRQLEGAESRTVVAVLVLIVALGTPLTFATVLATMIKTDEADQVPDSAPGQIRVVDGAEKDGPPQEVVEAVASALPSAVPSIFLQVSASDDEQATIPGDGGGLVMLVPTTASLERIKGFKLSGEQRQTLLAGGALTWARRSASGYVDIRIDSSRGTRTLTARAAPIRLDAAWEKRYSGVMLQRPAERRELPVSAGDVVFVDVSDSVALKARSAVVKAGLDSYYVKVYQPPEPNRAPPVFYMALLALSLMVVLVMTALSRTQATSLRRVLGGLVAVGVSPWWARRVLLLQLSFMFVVAAAFAFVLAGPVVGLTIARLPGYQFTVPWSWLVGITGGSLAAAFLGAGLGVMGLRPRDRLGLRGP